MPPLRPLKPLHLVKILAKFGFTPLRQKGSHLILKNSQGKTTVVPIHGSEEIDISLIRSILRECGIMPEEFYKVASGEE
ncbi:MAG: type II toxin-antitoxin system HicA family toxin [Candidatus Micrarchaeota archaeon]